MPGAATLSPESRPAEESCTDLIIGGTFHNVVVPEGATCTLVRSTLTGSLTALAGSSLTTSDNDIARDVKIESAADVSLAGDVIAGDVVIAHSAGADGSTPSYRLARLTLTRGNINVMSNSGISVSLRGNVVLEGSIRVLSNVNTAFSLIANQVAQDVLVVANRGPTNKMVRSTIAGHAITCQANDDPFVAAANVAPKLRGQCDVPFVE
jgi:hypothetical protein